ncbi:cardiolipin synthase ClsB [Betaproteobacteria bacterium SCN2]|jgi:cardiolipin synthase|nr:cardiolipin synthase ClsB [Betaproteobacteria bacterium SCN2]
MKGYLSGNRITLLKNGAEFFPALEAAFDQARERIHLETYIYREDAAGRRIAEALMRAARRGVDTHLLIDGFGSQPMPQGLLQSMREAGVRVLVYRPEVSRWRLRRYRLRRLHRKLALVDATVGFVGGINIVDDAESPDLPPQYDYAVAVEGPLVAALHATMRRLWNLVSWSQLRNARSRDHRRRIVVAPAGRVRARFLLRDNLGHRRDIEHAYLRAIGKARREIVIANAYFLPGTRLRHALIAAAERGVRVVVLVQGRTDHPLANYAKQAFYGRLLRAGVEIHEYHTSVLHAKTAVVDGIWATVGSSNLDPFSLVLSREANVVVYDRGFAAGLRASMQQEIDRGAVRVLPESLKNMPLYRRFLIWLSYGVVRAMMGMVNYASDDPEAGVRPRRLWPR